MKKIALLLATILSFMLVNPSALASWAAMTHDEILGYNVESESIVVATITSAKAYSFMSNGQMVTTSISTDGDLKQISLNVKSSIHGKTLPSKLTLRFCSGLEEGNTAVLGLTKLDKEERSEFKKNNGYDPGEYTINFQYTINEKGEVVTPNSYNAFAGVNEYTSGIKDAAKYIGGKVIDFKEQTYTAQLYYDCKIHESADAKSKVLLQGEAGDILTIYGSTVSKNSIKWTKVLLKDYTTAYVQTSNISKYRYTVPQGTPLARVTQSTPVYSKGMLIGYARENTLLPTTQKVRYATVMYYVDIPNFRAEIMSDVLSFENGNSPYNVSEEEIMVEPDVEEPPSDSSGRVDPTVRTKLYNSDFYYSITLKDEKLAISEQNRIIKSMGYPRTISINDKNHVSFDKKGPILFFRSGNKIVYYQGYNILSQKEMRKQFGAAFYTRMSPESIAASNLAVVRSNADSAKKPPYENVYWLSNNERYIVFVYKTEAAAMKARGALVSARSKGTMFSFDFENGEGLEMTVGQDASVFQKGTSLICYDDDLTPRGETYSEVRKQTNIYLAKLYGKQY